MQIQKSNNELSNKNIRNVIMGFEEQIRSEESSFIGDSDYCPLTHLFGGGMYIREIFIPKGTFLVGKIHKHEHPNFLMKGRVEVITEDGVEVLEAPLSMISKAGTKRALKTLEDCIWVTVHLNEKDTRDISELENYVIADSYEEYDRYRLLENASPIEKCLYYIKGLLTKKDKK